MGPIVFSLFVIALLTTPIQVAEAQSAAMPLPGLVVKDADGKVMGQVAGFHSNSSDFFPLVVLNVNGKLAYLFMRPYGLIDRVASNVSGLGGATVYFSNTDCVGDAYVNQVSETGLEGMSGNMYGVAGPDPITGVYQLYRSTTLTGTFPSLSSKWQGGSCVPIYGPTAGGVLAAEEVTPNPLAGFHGPTTLNPERILTVSGGDKLP